MPREEIRAWVQTLAIIAAGIWGVSTFIYKDIYAPKTAPINLSMELESKRIDQAKAGDANTNAMLPVQIKIVAKNPSKRTIYLLSSVWWARGLTAQSRETDENEFNKSVTDALNNRTGDYAERHTALTGNPLVAAGSLFLDTELRPDETVTRTLIIYLPPKYDKLEIITRITTSGKDPEGKLGLLWDKPGEDKWYAFAKDGGCKEISDDKFMNYEREFELQYSQSISEISVRQ